MNIATFDIEANGFYDEVNTVHCIAIKPLGAEVELYEPMEIRNALERMKDFDRLVAHNGIDYDARVIHKIYGIDFGEKVIDTLLLSKLNDASIHDHSLGGLCKRYNLTEQKKEYDGGFDVYTDEMGEYCKQDVASNEALFLLLRDKVDIESFPSWLEHNVRYIQSKAATNGVVFNSELASGTLQDINERMDVIRDKVDLGYSYNERSYNKKADGSKSVYCERMIASVVERFGFEPDVVEKKMKEQVVKKGRQIGEDKNGKPVYSQRKVWQLKEKHVVYEPDAITLDTQKQLKLKLMEKGWKPSFFTPKGNPKLVEDGEVCPNLLALGGEFKEIGIYQMLKHRKSLIEGLFKVVRDDGRIPSEADTLGAVTHRYTHKKIANFPKVLSDKQGNVLKGVEGGYGAEVRAMFTVGAGKKQVGADLAGLELRMLAHNMNDAAYTKEILEGDVHTANQKAAGLPTRDNAKTFIYGFLYGAGDAKIGTIINKGKDEGRKIKESFLAKFPALDNLIQEKQKEARRGYVTSLDGRHIRITRSVNKFTGEYEYDKHKALNSVLQSSGAIFAKTWMVYAYKYLTKNSINAIINIAYHDELQIEVEDNTTDIEGVKDALHFGVKEADRVLNTNCPNDIDIKVGNNWAECH